MAASRRGQKFGISIFDRVRGLLRAGAWSVEDKPIWYEVYRKFPPQTVTYNRNQTVLEILYPEDLIRKKFHHLYGHPDVIDCFDNFNERSKSTSQLFVDKYFELQKAGVPQEEIFDKTAAFFKLRRVDERKESMTHHRSDKVSESRLSFREDFQPTEWDNRKDFQRVEQRSQRDVQRDFQRGVQPQGTSGPTLLPSFAKLFEEESQKAKVSVDENDPNDNKSTPNR